MRIESDGIGLHVEVDGPPEGPPVVFLLVLAADDAMGAAFPTRHPERLAQIHPAVEVVRVRGAGHAIHDDREHRSDYLEHLVGFLAEHA